MTPHYVAFGILAGTFVIAELDLGLYALAAFGLPVLMLWIAEKQYLDRSRATVTELRAANDELEATNAQLHGLLEREPRAARPRCSTPTCRRSPRWRARSRRRTRIRAATPSGSPTSRWCSAAELGFDESKLPAINVGAIIHDIGKIGVPDAILLKPGPLDPDEFAEMRRHPEMSSYIVAELDLPADRQADGPQPPRALRRRRLPRRPRRRGDPAGRADPHRRRRPRRDDQRPALPQRAAARGGLAEISDKTRQPVLPDGRRGPRPGHGPRRRTSGRSSRRPSPRPKPRSRSEPPETCASRPPLTGSKLRLGRMSHQVGPACRPMGRHLRQRGPLGKGVPPVSATLDSAGAESSPPSWSRCSSSLDSSSFAPTTAGRRRRSRPRAISGPHAAGTSPLGQPRGHRPDRQVEVIVQLASGHRRRGGPRPDHRRRRQITRELPIIDGIGAKLDAADAQRPGHEPGRSTRSRSTPRSKSQGTSFDDRLVTSYNESIRARQGLERRLHRQGRRRRRHRHRHPGRPPDFRTRAPTPASRVIATAVVNPGASNAKRHPRPRHPHRRPDRRRRRPRGRPATRCRPVRRRRARREPDRGQGRRRGGQHHASST